MLVALRNMSLGDEVFQRGDAIPRELQEHLPPGRVETLKAQRYLEELTDEHELGRALDALTKRVEAMERKLDSPAKKRKAA